MRIFKAPHLVICGFLTFFLQIWIKSPLVTLPSFSSSPSRFLDASFLLSPPAANPLYRPTSVSRFYAVVKTSGETLALYYCTCTSARRPRRLGRVEWRKEWLEAGSEQASRGRKGEKRKWLRSSISAYLSVALVLFQCNEIFIPRVSFLLLLTTCFPLNPKKGKLFIRAPFAFLFCTIVGLKKLEMGASIHRPIFARGPAHCGRTSSLTTARRRWFPPFVCGHYQVPTLPPSWPLCLVRSSCC